jgi:hypothetical protein
MMNSTGVSQWLIRLIVAVALPAVTCFGYYSLEFLDADESIWALPVMLAYPVTLIGLVGFSRALVSSRRSRLALSFWTLCIIVPIILLLWVRV